MAASTPALRGPSGLASRADVAVADLHDEAAGAVVKEIEASGGRAIALRADTSREDDCEAMAEATASELGPIDVCVAAADISHALYVSGQPRGNAREDRTTSSVLEKPG